MCVWGGDPASTNSLEGGQGVCVGEVLPLPGSFLCQGWAFRSGPIQEGSMLHEARCALQGHPQTEEPLRKVAAEGKGRDVHMGKRLKPSRKEEPHDVFLHSSKQPIS